MKVLRACLVVALVLFPLLLNAHGRYDGVSPLTVEQVSDIVSKLQAIDTRDFSTKSSEVDATDFLEEAAIEFGENDGQAARVLLMYEAIRRKAYSETGYESGADIFLWPQLIHIGDFQSVQTHFEAIDIWFKAQLDEESK